MSNSKNTKIYSPKKLIEVALPLDDINEAASREKSIRHGHPSTLHLWWARRPSAAARAVIFAQMVNDPGYQQDGGFKYGVNKKEAEFKREKLFQIIRDLVKWENTNNEVVLNRAREAIKESWKETCHLNRNHPQAAELFNPEKLPAFHDPFAGGGAIPLEAQRLGLESYASDLNPVAVMINKAMIEIPPKFAGKSPVGPLPEDEKQHNFMEDWSGVKGLAEDVHRYGDWIQEEAFRRIGHLYPKVKITEEMAEEREDLKPYVNQELTVIAYLWARTVKSPNPAYSHVDVPLLSNFILTSNNNVAAYLEPVINGDKYQLKVKLGVPSLQSGTKLSRGANFRCIISDSLIDGKYIKAEGVAGRLGSKLTALVVEGPCGRIYLSASQQQEDIAKNLVASWKPELKISGTSQYLGVLPYGATRFDQLFTARQTIALITIGDLINESLEKFKSDAVIAGFKNDSIDLENGGIGALAYAQAITTYLAFALDKCADYWNMNATWMPRGTVGHLFSKHAIQMTWDFPEANPFSDFHCSWLNAVEWVKKAIITLPAKNIGFAVQANASCQSISHNKVISTDPPYYDNIPYADLSDFFYVWMRKSLKSIYPALFATLAVPKQEELVAFAYRHLNKKEATSFFLNGMTEVMRQLAEISHPLFPVTIYYAFKQSDTDEIEGTANTGWEVFLEAVIRANFVITGTWPMRTERSNRSRGIGSNALASSIVLVCRKRAVSAASISRREFIREINTVLPDALLDMTCGETNSPVAPVDLSQAIIGPGMAVYSKYSAVLNQDGGKMTVHEALILINRAITDYLNPNSGNFDADTLFCDDWFNQYGWGEGQFGVADTLARAKGTSVEGVRDAGVIEAGGGKVRLLKWSEYPKDWDPKTDTRTPVWEACHQMIRVLNQQGENEAGRLLAKMPERGETIRQLAYHLYTLCERKKWASDARAYNELIGSWHDILAASHEIGHKGTQTKLGFDFEE